jgi:hypothetical protein
VLSTGHWPEAGAVPAGAGPTPVPTVYVVNGSRVRSGYELAAGLL